MYINFSHIVLMNILLVGCTGFLGKSLIHYLITHTRHNIILVLRPKHSLSIDERLQDILNEMDITDVGRIKLINVCYDEMRNIEISDKDRKYIEENNELNVKFFQDVEGFLVKK